MKPGLRFWRASCRAAVLAVWTARQPFFRLLMASSASVSRRPRRPFAALAERLRERFARHSGQDTKLVADPVQRPGQRLQRQMLAPLQDVAEHVLGESRGLAKGSPVGEVALDKFRQFIAVVADTGQAGGHSDSPTQIRGDLPKN